MATDEVPARFPVAINDRPYMMDAAGYQRQSVPIHRDQSDQTSELGEQSMNPRAGWRRSQDSWHHGTGQEFFDGKIGGTPTDPERYSTADYADPWTRGQVGLLPGVTKCRNNGKQVLAAGNHAYCRDTQQVYWFNNPASTADSWTSADIQAGQAAQNVESIATDGRYIWAALGSSGLHRTVRGASTSTADVPAQACTLVGYALGRLLIANGHQLYEVLPAITAPVANLIFTHPDTDFEFKFISPGRNVIYAGGNIETGTSVSLNTGIIEGGNAEVYKFTLGTDTAVVYSGPATYLPDGEQIYDCRFYAGGIIMATSRGLRVGVADSQGNIDYGPNFAKEAQVTGWPIHALEPQDRYVWFSWHPGTGTPGLGRADLGFFTDTLTPAYAADVRIDSVAFTPFVDSAATLANGKLLFSLFDGANAVNGVYRRNGTSEAKAVLATAETGQIRFSTSDPKYVIDVEIRHDPLLAGESIEVWYKKNGGAWGALGTSDVDGSTGKTITGTGPGTETLELRFVLARGNNTALGATLLRWTVRAIPTPKRVESFTFPLILRPTVRTFTGDVHPVNISDEIAALKALEENGTVFFFQVGNEELVGYIEDSAFEGEAFINENTGTPSYGVERMPAGIYTVKVTTLGWP